MTYSKCKKHDRYNCIDPQCSHDNAGEITLNTDGDLALGIGSGLAMDLSDGSIGIKVGGIVIDTD